MTGWRDKDRKQPKREASIEPSSKSGAGRPPRSGWRSDRSARASSAQHWKEASVRRSSFGRRFKLGGLLTLSVVLIALLCSWLLNMPVAVPFIAITPAAYEHPLPPLALAREDVGRFQDVLGRSHRNVVLDTSERQLRSPADYLDELRYRLQQVGRPGGPTKNVVILYLRAHGVVASNGNPCLLLPASKSLDESTWLPAAQIFDVIQQWDPNSKYQKLLLLDVGGPRRLWIAGVLHNSFVRRLEALVDSEASSGITVIHAAGAGQISHVAAEIRGTAFAHYLAEGIRGEADADSDDIISLHELHQYVRDRVRSFAHQRRADIQEPVLLPPSAEDFAVAHASSSARSEVVPFAAPVTFELDGLWRRFAKLRSAMAYSRDPSTWSELEAKLVRLESLLLAGQQYASQLDQTDVSGLMDDLERSMRMDPSTASSLKLASRSIPGPVLDQARIEVQQWRQAVGTDAAKPIPNLSEPIASRIAWEAARAGGRTDLQTALAILNSGTARRAVAYSEIQYLRLLARWIDWEGETPTLLEEALSCQQAAEAAAAPADPRAHYWIRKMILQADRVHDVVMDAMLEGSHDGQRRALSAVGQLTGHDGGYTQAKQIGELVSLAYRLRDEAWATIPHLAAWIDSEAWSDSAGVQTDGQVRSDAYALTLSKLIVATHELSDAIDRMPTNLTSADQISRRLDQGISEVEIGLRALLAAFDEKCSTLLHDESFKDDERTIRQIAAVLELPLLPNNDVVTRSALRSRLLAHRSKPYDGAGTSSDSGVRNDAQYIHWLCKQEVPHVLSALDRTLLDPKRETIPGGNTVDPLPIASTSSDQLRRLANVESEVRLRLASVKSSATKLASKQTSGAPHECRAGLAKADRLVRAAAPILANRLWDREQRAQDPVRRLGEFDQTTFHLWHGERILRSWWGPLDDRQPYFVEASQLQLAARSAYAEQPPKGRPEIQRAAEYQEILRQAIFQQQQILESWQPAVEAPGITVTSDSIDHSIKSIPAPGMPSGQVALYLSDGERMLSVLAAEEQARRRAVDLSRPHVLSHTVTAARQLSLGSLRANALFRGHHRVVDFNVDDPGQVTVVWSESAVTPPRITVRGDSKEKSQIVFVLDCSGSMGTEYRLGKSRLEVAIDTLKDTVRLLGDDHHVGLVLYGHRNSWGNYTTNKGINPVEDVEVARGVLINDQAGQVELIAKLANLRPRGETPLYRAIRTAVQSLQRRPEGSKHVVVISDGFQQLPPGYAGTSIEQVVDAWKEFRPRIDIVPIVGNLTAEQRTTLRRLTDLNGLNGMGTLHDEVDARNLADKIKSTLRLLNFQVTDVETGITSPPIPLGRYWEANDVQQWDSRQPQRAYRVQLDSATKQVELEGGEHLDILYNRRRRQLEFEPFLQDAEQRIEIPDLNDSFAVSHYPRREGDSHYFQVSIQNNQRDFSPRPRQVWAEITPLSFVADQRVLHAFDCDFKQSTPVPVLQFRVRNWPGAESARMQLWVRFEETIGDEREFTIPLDRPSTIDYSKTISLVATPESMGGGMKGLVIVETHNVDSDDYPLRIRVLPGAKRTEHQYFSKSRRVHHLFTLDEQNSIRVGISAKSHLQRGWYSTEPFDVSMPNR